MQTIATLQLQTHKTFVRSTQWKTSSSIVNENLSTSRCLISIKKKLLKKAIKLIICYNNFIFLLYTIISHVINLLNGICVISLNVLLGEDTVNWTGKESDLYFRAVASAESEKGRVFPWINFNAMSHRSNLSPNRVGDEWDAYIHSSLSESLAIRLEGSALSFPPKVATLPPAARSSAEVQIRGNARWIKPSPSRVSRDTTKEAPASTEAPRIETPEKLTKKLTFESRIF